MSFSKSITLSLAGIAIAVPCAMAQTVELYGKVYPYVVNERGSGATPVGTTVSTLSAAPTGANAIPNQPGMQAGNSRWGMRGKEDLGGGLQASFQLETTVAVDTGAGSGFTRDTFVALDGGFGRLQAGLIDTVLKDYGDTLGTLGVSSGTFASTSDVFRKTGFGTSSASSFHLRRPNSLRYTSPENSGFVASFQWSSDETKVPTSPRDAQVVSMGLKYENGPWYLALAHEIHDDLFGGSRNAPKAMSNYDIATNPNVRSSDKATQFAVEYRLDNKHKFEFDILRKYYDESATVTGRFQSYQNTAYLLAMETRWSEQFRTTVHYVKANDGTCTLVAQSCNTQGLATSKIGFGAAYYLSKRTMLYGLLSHISNGKSARFDNAEFGVKPNVGENIHQAAIGLSHSF